MRRLEVITALGVAPPESPDLWSSGQGWICCVKSSIQSSCGLIANRETGLLGGFREQRYFYCLAPVVALTA